MIEVKTVIDKEEATAFLRARGIETDLQPLFVMCATEKGKLLGVGAVSMDSKGAVIEEVVCDEDIDWLIGKALLNSLELGGIMNVGIQKESLFKLAKMLRFKENGAVYTVNLEGYFEAGCSGCGNA